MNSRLDCKTSERKHSSATQARGAEMGTVGICPTKFWQTRYPKENGGIITKCVLCVQPQNKTKLPVEGYGFFGLGPVQTSVLSSLPFHFAVITISSFF